MSHQKNRGLSKKRRGEISQRAFKRAQERNEDNRLHNKAQEVANKHWLAANAEAAADARTHARPAGVKTNRGRGNPNRLSVLRRSVERASQRLTTD
jgi:hypothetical protein